MVIGLGYWVRARDSYGENTDEGGVDSVIYGYRVLG